MIIAEKEIPLLGINSIAPGLLLGYDLLLKGCPTEAATPVTICAWHCAGVIAEGGN
ncbi:MAG: hypothetical protein KAY50_11600 [Chitinophagaceae bacterium]|nr:hypothetical protein [Chitinophagaceae bacterium]